MTSKKTSVFHFRNSERSTMKTECYSYSNLAHSARFARPFHLHCIAHCHNWSFGHSSLFLSLSILPVLLLTASCCVSRAATHTALHLSIRMCVIFYVMAHASKRDDVQRRRIEGNPYKGKKRTGMPWNAIKLKFQLLNNFIYKFSNEYTLRISKPHTQPEVITNTDHRSINR